MSYPEGEQAVVFYTHYESIFYSNEGNSMLWHPDSQLPLRKKGHGQSIMVSDFLSELKGPLKTVDGSGQVFRAREIINPGKKKL